MTDIDTLKRAAELLREVPDVAPMYLGSPFIECRNLAAAIESMAERMAQGPVAWQVHAPYFSSRAAIPRGLLKDAIPLYAAPQPTPEDVRDAIHPLDALLPELCQLLDAFKREAESNSEGWTEWDESVRTRLRQVIADYNIATMQQEKAK